MKAKFLILYKRLVGIFFYLFRFILDFLNSIINSIIFTFYHFIESNYSDKIQILLNIFFNINLFRFILYFFIGYLPIIIHLNIDPLIYYGFLPDLLLSIFFLDLLFFIIIKNIKLNDLFITFNLISFIYIYFSIHFLINLNIMLDFVFYYNNLLIIIIKILVILVFNLIFFLIKILKDAEVKWDNKSFIIFYLNLLSIIFLLSSKHIFFCILLIELQSYTLYILCSIYKHSSKSIESGIKYFTTGGYISIFFLLGSSFIYYATGTLSFPDLIIYTQTSSHYDVIFVIGLVFFFIGFLFKLMVMPYNIWSLDVYEGTNIVVTFFLSILPKIPLFLLFINFFFFFFSYIFFLKNIMFFLGLISIIACSILIFYETKFKKFIAISSTITMGFMFMCLSLCEELSICIAVIFYFVYIFNLIYFFTLYILIKSFNKNDFITNLFSYCKNNKFLSILMSISLLSLIGIPPLMGFFLKFVLFYVFIKYNNYFICFFLILISIISCIYYVRFIRFLFFDVIKIDFKSHFKPQLAIEIIIILIFFSFVCLFFYFYFYPLLFSIKFFFKLCIY